MTTITEFVLVTGMTGAGRSTAAKALEKLGYYVVDNLPPGMLGELLAQVESAQDINRLAVVVDSRSRTFFAGLTDAIAEIQHSGTAVRTVFLEAADDVLVRRQEAARRPHPLSAEGRLMDGFVKERELLKVLRGRADMVIDTSSLNVNQLSARMRHAFEQPTDQGLNITLVSFGFKYGVPIDANLIADMRFLPNPFWVPELQPQTGLDSDVSAYVLAQSRAAEFLEEYERLIDLLTDGFVAEDKLYLTIGIGCTGGKHRSVAMTEALSERLKSKGGNTLVVHRDLGKE